MSAVSYTRDRETARTLAGIRLDPIDLSRGSVHLFETWIGETMAVTACGEEADFNERARQTRDTISCSACAEASWRAAQAWIRQIRWHR